MIAAAASGNSLRLAKLIKDCPMDDPRAYHLERARVERELARRSGETRASVKHIYLSALHLERLEMLDREAAERAGWSSRLGAREK